VGFSFIHLSKFPSSILWIVLPKFVVAGNPFPVFCSQNKYYLFSSKGEKKTLPPAAKAQSNSWCASFSKETFSSRATSYHHPPSNSSDAPTGFLVQFLGRSEPLKSETNKYCEQRLDISIAVCSASVF
jgi:hypothetical protein